MSGDNRRQVVLLKGGRGGNGNHALCDQYDAGSPKYAQPGQPAQELEADTWN